MPKNILTISTIITCIVVTLLTLVTIIQNYKQTKIATLTNCSTATIEYNSIKSTLNKRHIILLGDSRIKDWGTPSFGEDITVTNLGIAGETTYQNIHRLDKVLALRPDLLILQIGINDIIALSLLPSNLQMQAQEESILNLKRILNKISASNTNTLLLTIIPPISPNLIKKMIWGKNITELTKDFNQTLRMEKGGAITVFNMKQVFWDTDTKNWQQGYSKDALHWTDIAYQSLITAIKDQLAAQPALLR